MTIDIQIHIDLTPRQKRIIRWAVVSGAAVGALGLGVALAQTTLPTFTTNETLQASDLNTMSTAIAALQAQPTGDPPGTVVAYAGPVVPSGWLLCDGSAVSRTQYANLFSAMGTSSGSGDGATTFNLPDYRGRFLRGVDADAGIDPDRNTRTAASAGGNVGDLVGSLETGAFASHTHTISDPGHTHPNPGTGWYVLHTPNSSLVQYSIQTGTGLGALDGTATNSAMTGITQTNAYGGSETRPINVYVNYIIKY
jgi:microcystin-dependent protein